MNYVIAANNSVTATSADGRRPEHVISIQIHPVPNANYYARDAAGRYPFKTLRSTGVTPPFGTTRTFAVSPFPSDEGQVMFIGGYDADKIPSHNTAWVLRSPLGRDEPCW